METTEGALWLFHQLERLLSDGGNRTTCLEASLALAESWLQEASQKPFYS